MNLGHRLALADNERLTADNERLRRRVAELEDFIAVVSPDVDIDLTEQKAADTEER